MAKGGGKQTTTTGPDAASQAYIDQMRGAAQGAANAGAAPVNPYTTQAAQFFGGIAQGGNLGFGALTGDPAATARFMNPYTSDVVNASLGDFAHTRDMAMQGVNGDATAAGAFGGDRQGVAQGVALGNITRGEDATLAGLRQGGYEDAMQRAVSAANMGMGAAGQMAGLGDYMRNIEQLRSNPDLWKLSVLQGGLGPMGQTTTTTQTPGHNWASGLLGGAVSGGEMGAQFGPWGMGIGAGLGGLLGAFGG